MTQQFGNKPMTFIFFGRSGCGKGTQAQLLIDLLKADEREVLYIETGKEFRSFAQQENLTARLTKSVIEGGQFMPAFMPIWIWVNQLVEKFNGSQDLVLDGMARRITEAPILDSALKFYDRHDVCVIHIDVSKQWSIDRLMARGRNDDKPAEIEKRLTAYDMEVGQVLEYFNDRKGYHYIKVNGEQTIEKVHTDILDAVAARNLCE